MKIFLALLSKSRPLSQIEIQEVAGLAESALPFSGQPSRRQIWLAESGLVAVVAWDNDVVSEPESPIIVRSELGVRSMTGHVVDSKIANGWSSEEVLEAIEFTPASVADLGGSFAFLEAMAIPPMLLVFNNISRAEPVYWTETSDEIVIGSRAAMTQLAARRLQRPEIDPTVLSSLVVKGFFSNALTPFRGVQVMEPGRCLIATSNGVSSQPLDDIYERTDSRELDDQYLDELAEAFYASARMAHGRRVEIGLSGGKDSRTVAAALCHVGAEVTALTRGMAGNDEVEVAKLVAARLNLPHHIYSTFGDAEGYFEVDLMARVRLTLQRSDGMISAWENIPTAESFRDVVVTGGQGSSALLVGYYPSIQHLESPTLADFDRVLMRSHRRFSDILTEEAMRLKRGVVRAWIGEHAYLGIRKVASVYRVDSYQGRWMAEMSGSYFNELQLRPFHDNRVFRLSMLLPPEPRANHWASYQLLKRIAPDLADIPLAGKRWPFEQQGPRAGDEAGWMRRTPIMSIPGSRAAFEWRHLWTKELFNTFYEQLFRNEAVEPVFSVLDRSAFEAWFLARRGEEPLHYDTALAWGALTAATLVENNWLQHAGSRQIQRIALPPV